MDKQGVFHESGPARMSRVAARPGRLVFLVAVVQIDQRVTMDPVACEQNQDHEIRDEQRHVEGIGVVNPLECGVKKMLANVL